MGMTLPRLYNVIGLMSGTSLDGIDVAWIETDGISYVRPLGFLYFPYSETLRNKIRLCFGAKVRTQSINETEIDLTMAHADAIQKMMDHYSLTTKDIDMVGFHGQTITHDPDHGFTWQLGHADLLAVHTGLPVVYDFRTEDVSAGGQGAPLIPIYHQARAVSSDLSFPVAILNIGGVSNVTWMDGREDGLFAFDCGPGNALIDDYVLKSTGARFDKDGQIAFSGKVHPAILSRWLSHPYFQKPPPKSLDRGAWDVDDLSELSCADAVATLTGFTAAAIADGVRYFPAPVRGCYVTGGGRLNPALMDALSKRFECPVAPVESLGWNGDALEAEGFAYLAVRSVLGLPLSYPRTTGVPYARTGGKITGHRA